MSVSIFPRSVGVHDGSFHADEVTACALLCLFDLIDEKQIIRSRDPEILKKCEYVCDVGGIYDPQSKRFDHHQVEYKGSKSSAGMVLSYLKEFHFCEWPLYHYLNQSLILGVDAHDLGLSKLEPGVCSFSQVISNFLPIEYSASSEEQTKAFFDAFHFTLGHLKRLLKRFSYIKSCREKIQASMKKSSSCLFFDEPISWLENFFELGGESHPALFVIMPTGDHWKLRSIPPNLNHRMQMRLPLPLEWAGLHDEDLKKISHIPGAVFCHKSRFVSIWETKEDAIKALEYTLKKRNLKKT